MKIRDKNLGEIVAELKNILTLAKKYWGAVVVFTVMALFSTVFGILASLVSQSLIDIVTGSPTPDSILNFVPKYDFL